MKAKHINPILNVSNIEESFTWFEKLGWEKGWDWGDPPVFGAVCSGDREIFFARMVKVVVARVLEKVHFVLMVTIALIKDHGCPFGSQM